MKPLPIYLQNTATKEKEVFTPLVPGVVKMYTCGPTVYNEPHIGNLRAFIFSDILHRVFAYNAYDVTRVINITDVGHIVADSEEGEDKMEKRAKETGKRAKDIAKEITQIFFTNLQQMGVDTTVIQFPRATEYIDGQIEMTKTLMEKGYAYGTKSGIAFDVTKFKGYGALGNITIDDLKAGARIDTNPDKKHQADFWLWKFNKTGKKRQQEWPSPWGVGFPGWHLECSVMSRTLLGKHLDVHTGGVDHIPVHHNNEIAQSEAASGQKFVNYWMHNAHLMFDGKRFEKSSGHVIYLRQLIERGYNTIALRYLLLGTKYSVEQNFTWEALDAATTALKKLQAYTSANFDKRTKGIINPSYQKQFNQAINDDLATPKALAILWELFKDARITDADKVATMLNFDTVLGLHLDMQQDPSEVKKVFINDAKIPKEINALLKARKDARDAKEWKKADTARDKIKSLGYKIIDDGEKQELVAL